MTGTEMLETLEHQWDLCTPELYVCALIIQFFFIYEQTVFVSHHRQYIPQIAQTRTGQYILSVNFTSLLYKRKYTLSKINYLISQYKVLGYFHRECFPKRQYMF